MLSQYRITAVNSDLTRLKNKLLQDKAKRDLLLQHKQRVTDEMTEA